MSRLSWRGDGSGSRDVASLCPTRLVVEAPCDTHISPADEARLMCKGVGVVRGMGLKDYLLAGDVYHDGRILSFLLLYKDVLTDTT